MVITILQWPWDDDDNDDENDDDDDYDIGEPGQREGVIDNRQGTQISPQTQGINAILILIIIIIIILTIIKCLFRHKVSLPSSSLAWVVLVQVAPQG